jgi:DNA mismatch endonuclease (patch repair protein)
MDVFDQATRSKIMARVKSKDTQPELRVRRFLFSRGFRFRLHVKALPGAPDIVLKKYNTVIFVHGCFWHSHAGCRYATIPKTNGDKWREKLSRNKSRDAGQIAALLTCGWKVVVIWECGITKQDYETQLEWLESAIKNSLTRIIEWPALI